MATKPGTIPVTNELIEQVMAQSSDTTEVEAVEIAAPPVDTVFDLPGGYLSPVGEVAYEVEVRELTGRDEEAIAKAPNLTKVLNLVLQRGIVRVGEIKPDEIVVNNLLAGDRDYALLRIYAATFGSEVTMGRHCHHCSSDVELKIDLLNDIKVRRLDEAGDRRFVVECSVGDVLVDLPTGHTQRELLAVNDKSLAEMSTTLLANTVLSIDGREVIGAAQVRDLPIRDRRKISDELVSRNPGPQMQDITVECPRCSGELEVAIPIAGLFQF